MSLPSPRALRAALVAAGLGLVGVALPAIAEDPAPAAAPAPARPDWLSEAEQAFLDSTGGLRPIATYDKGKGLVTIKLKKAGLTMDAIFKVAVGPTYDYYRHTELVETSFRGSLDGKDYLFTGTQVLALGAQVAFVPVVSTLTQARDDDKITIAWRKADQATATRMLDANADKLKKAMEGAGVDDSYEEYRKEIDSNLASTQKIVGRHVYYPATGWYIYEQEVVMTGKVSDFIARYAGSDDITGAALKVAYQVLGESARAGGRGTEGAKVQAMDGDTLRPGP